MPNSSAAFSVPIVVLLTAISTTLLGMGDDPMPAAQISAIWEAVFGLFYVAIIIPVVGSGFIIWVHSVREAYKRRDLASFGVAGWNTFAQVNNTVSMFRNFGGALDGFGKIFKGDNAKNAAPLLVIALVVVALLSSVLLTVHLIQYYAKNSTSRIDELARA